MTKAQAHTVLGIIGGSGLYDMPGLSDAQWKSMASPWGAPSDDLLFAYYDDLPVVFLPRHGRGHTIPPGEINYRANIDVLKRAGVTDLVSLSAVGSLKEQHAPGTFVLIDQFIDRTRGRAASFFGKGCVAHVSLAFPVSPSLVDHLETAAQKVTVPCHRSGTYLAMEGPQFSSLAESRLYRQWGCDVIGMTNMPEARLAREAEICYASVAMVTDYDSWHPDHGEVDVTRILQVLVDNKENAQKLVVQLVADFPRVRELCPIGSDRALEYAVITPPEARDPALVAKLDAIAGRVLGQEAANK